LRGEPSTCLVDLPGDAAPLAEARHDPYLWSGIVAGAGAISVIGGTALLASKGDPSAPSGGPSYLSWPGVVLIAGGGVAIGAAAYLAKRASGTTEAEQATLRQSRAPIYAAAATAAAAFVAGGYLLHIDGTGTCGRDEPGSCYYRYRSALYGWTLIGAGLAATGFGVYWQLGVPGDSHGPSVGISPTDSGAMASIRGSF
jgi:hypothetical protein